MIQSLEVFSLHQIYLILFDNIDFELTAVSSTSTLE